LSSSQSKAKGTMNESGRIEKGRGKKKLRKVDGM
jgi:hypothetical protein